MTTFWIVLKIIGALAIIGGILFGRKEDREFLLQLFGRIALFVVAAGALVLVAR